jgi:hypothetical protein
MILASHGIIGSSIVQFVPDVDAQAFFDRVTTAGGTLSNTEKSAVNQLVLDMKDDGIWSKMKAVYPFVGASAAACAQNLKSSSFTGTFTATGWTFASTGVTPNGTSAYIDTNLNISTNLSLASNHLSFYSRTSILITNGFGLEIGNLGVYNANSTLALRIRSNNLVNKYYTIGQDNGVGQNNTNGLGFSLGVSSSLTSRKLFYNGLLLNTNTATNLGSLINQNVSIGQGTGGFSRNECALASIGDGLTDTEASDFYDAVQAFQETLNREV